MGKRDIIFHVSQQRVCLLFWLLVFFHGVQPAFSHPHAWIDLRTEIRFNESGKATALSQIWLLDPAYSSFATVGLDKDRDGKPDWAALDALLQENMSNLKKYDYFTQIFYGSKLVKFGEIVQMSSRMQGGRLEMRFVVPFKEPIKVSDKRKLSYLIFDPTYYIEIVHEKKNKSVSLVRAPAGCTSEVKEPNPDAGTVMLAASLDKTQSGGLGLGKFFAETVNIECPTQS
ncbi:MAG: hypothetical protein CMM44_04040 [Rhodospirillaceae bacterium]|nr:hypothetical protein [Rhodospirillaceae bacterium]|tara:strand:+ start:681 stop:1367 length:687 start_codon:yes stop_codon:yes gene_type:complete